MPGVLGVVAQPRDLPVRGHSPRGHLPRAQVDQLGEEAGVEGDRLVVGVVVGGVVGAVVCWCHACLLLAYGSSFGDCCCLLVLLLKDEEGEGRDAHTRRASGPVGCGQSDRLGVVSLESIGAVESTEWLIGIEPNALALAKPRKPSSLTLAPTGHQRMFKEPFPQRNAYTHDACSARAQGPPTRCDGPHGLVQSE